MNAEFAIGGKTLETARLLLRPFRQTDLDDFYAYASVEGVGEMAGWQHHESKKKRRKYWTRSFVRTKYLPWWTSQREKLSVRLGWKSTKWKTN